MWHYLGSQTAFIPTSGSEIIIKLKSISILFIQVSAIYVHAERPDVNPFKKFLIKRMEKCKFQKVLYRFSK